MTVETQIIPEENVRIEISYFRTFQWRNGEPGSGFSFPCDKNGNIDVMENELAKENFAKCLDGTFDVIDQGVKPERFRVRLCNCGSLEEREAVYDARGIFVAYVCSKCRKKQLGKYRREIFEDSDYETDEPIDEE